MTYTGTSFIGYSGILNFNQQTEYFHKKINSQLSKSAVFGSVMSKIEFDQNWLYGYVLYYGFGSKEVKGNFP